MTKLKISFQSTATTLEAAGEIFSPPVDENEPPLVNDVRTGNGHDALFPLEPGTYEYWFQVTGWNQSVKFTLFVYNRDTGALLAQKELDTKSGTAGRVLKFTVPA